MMNLSFSSICPRVNDRMGIASSLNGAVNREIYVDANGKTQKVSLFAANAYTQIQKFFLLKM